MRTNEEVLKDLKQALDDTRLDTPGALDELRGYRALWSLEAKNCADQARKIRDTASKVISPNLKAGFESNAMEFDSLEQRYRSMMRMVDEKLNEASMDPDRPPTYMPVYLR